MECIDNMGFPTSTVRIPIFESIGPTVLPHGLGTNMDQNIKTREKEKLTYHFEPQILVPYHPFAEQAA